MVQSLIINHSLPDTIILLSLYQVHETLLQQNGSPPQKDITVLCSHILIRSIIFHLNTALDKGLFWSFRHSLHVYRKLCNYFYNMGFNMFIINELTLLLSYSIISFWFTSPICLISLVPMSDQGESYSAFLIPVCPCSPHTIPIFLSSIILHVVTVLWITESPMASSGS